MQVFPPNAADKLGFGIIIDRVRHHLRSKRGHEALTMEHPSCDADEVAGRLAEVADVQQILQFDDPLPWGELPDVHALLKTIRPEESVPEPFDLLDLRQVVLASETLRKYLSSRKAKYPSLRPYCDAIPDLAALGTSIESAVGPDGEILDSASETLRRVRSSIAARERELRSALQKELRSAISSGFATEDQPTIRNGRMVIPVRAEAKRKVRGFVQDASATGQTVFIEPEACLELNNDVRELQAEERREVRRVLASLGDGVRRVLDEVVTITGLLAQFDVIQAKARVANEIAGIVPVLEGTNRVMIRAGCNPALALHLSMMDSEDDHPRTVVPLDFEMTSDRKTVLITGPNAGGKTVALGTIGLFTLMIGHGIPIPADEGTEIPIFRKLYIDIGDEQSIEDDLSTFSSHIRNLREMLSEADHETLVLIDEAGTGTDPEEGAALAQAAFEALNNAGAWTVATTHHGRLKAFAHTADFARNAAMEFSLDTLEPTYRLQMDLPGSSYAFEIGRRLELPDSMLDRARELLGAPATSLEDLIVDYQARVRDLEQQQDDLRGRLEAAEATKADYEAKRRELEQGRSRRRMEMLEEGQGILRKANAMVERTIRQIKESQADREATRTARAELDAFRQDVDEALAAERVNVEEESMSSRQPSRDTGRIEAGDQVVLDDGNVTAEVIEVDGDEVVISSGALRMRVDPTRLRKVGGKRAQQVHVRQRAAPGGSAPALGVSQRLDVRGQRVDQGLQSVGRFIDEALPTSLKRLEILHGKGTGALRKAIHDYLEERADVSSFEEADWEQGGAGVTIVRLA